MNQPRWKKVVTALSLLSLLGLGSCKATGKMNSPMLDLEFALELDPFSGAPVPPRAEPLGKGELCLADGTKLKGDYYDTDGDGIIDKFKPTAGQSGGGVSGQTNGTDWYEVTPN